MNSTVKDNCENIVHIPFDLKIDSNKGLGEYLLDSLKKHGNDIAQIDSVSGKIETYNEYLERCIQLAKALKNWGITSDDVVAYCCYNNMDYFVTIIATLFLGACANGIDISRSKDEITHCLKLSKPKIIFCDQEIENIIEEAALHELNLDCEIVVYNQSEKFISFNKFNEKYKSKEEFSINTSKTAQDTAFISYTSGTSGLSKAVELPHFGLYYGGVTINRICSDAKIIMVFTLPYWISNISFSIFAMLYGYTRIIYKYFNKDNIYQVMHKFKVNRILLTQSMMNDLIENKNRGNYDIKELKYILYGGSNIGANQIIQLNQIFPCATFLNIYGMTEFSGLAFIPEQKACIVGNKVQGYSIGKPNPGIHYKIVDTDTEKALGPNKNGELRIKFRGIMNGYLNNPKATEEAFDEDGFFKTGDIIYYDTEYFFYVADRMKEIFKYKGYHISPTIIETELLLHPAVKDAAVIGIPHDKFGELPMGVVILKNNSVIEEKEIIEFVNARLQSEIYHIRAGVKIVKTLPKTTTGKLRRSYLRDQIIKGEI